MIEIVFVPLGEGKFEAKLGDEVIATSTRTPFCDAARALLRRGLAGETLIARHLGSQTVALKSTVAGAANLTVSEDEGRPRFRKWRPHPRSSRD